MSAPYRDSPSLEAQESPWRDAGEQYSDSPEFERLTQDLSDKLFTMTSNNNRLQKQVELLGTKRETARVRERVQDLVEETSNGFKDIGEGLKKVSAWPDLGVSWSVDTEKKRC
jgi:hypothetical protein